MHQRAVGVGLAANKAIAAGDVGDAASLVPNYLRLSQAERERLEKEK
jgi:tRNA threonylcarbamoyladenosine biosynthesis protein TsaB